MDLGNACIESAIESDDIQTMEYKCPQTVLGIPYSCKADVWSLACVVFEILTGDFLFKPKKYSDKKTIEKNN